MYFKPLLAIVVVGAMTTSFAFAENLECDDVLVRSSSTSGNISEHSRKVAQCLETVDNATKVAYRMSFDICENIARYKEAPEVVELPSGTTVEPRTAETWEEYALRLGDEANSSGCRDGIHSAMFAKVFASTQTMRDLFTESEMFIPNVLLEHVSMTVDTGFGRVDADVRFAESSFRGHFTDPGSLNLLQGRKIEYKDASFVGDGVLDGQISALFLNVGIGSDYNLEGRISGVFDPSSMSVTVTSLEIDSYTIDEFYLSEIGLEQLNSFIAQDRVCQELQVYLTAELRAAYNEIDPFSFLRSL